MSRHIGNILETAIRKREYPISQLAKRIGYTRQHMYNLFQQSKIDLLLMEKIGKVINYDFTEEINALKKYVKPGAGLDTSVKNIAPDYETLERKYIVLLEEHNRLLKEYATLLRKMTK